MEPMVHKSIRGGTVGCLAIVGDARRRGPSLRPDHLHPCRTQPCRTNANNGPNSTKSNHTPTRLKYQFAGRINCPWTQLLDTSLLSPG